MPCAIRARQSDRQGSAEECEILIIYLKAALCCEVSSVSSGMKVLLPASPALSRPSSSACFKLALLL